LLERARQRARVVNLGTARLEALYRSVTEGKPANARSLHVKSILAQQNGRLQEAAELSGKAVTLEPDTAEYLRQLGSVCGEARWWEPAVNALNRAIYADPDDAQSWYILGRVFDRLGSHQHAETCYTQCLDIDPGFGDARRALETMAAAPPA
jgi:tetratricopeptide (TPR) repeat protein